jgi:lysozyme
MKTSEAGITLIKNFEGFSAKAYKCPAGKITIGYGHTAPELTMKDTITRARAEEILKSDVKWAEAAVNKVTVPLTQNQFDALVALVFNIGAAAFAKSTLLKLLNKGQYDSVPAQLARWNKIGKESSPGLTRRRQAEADMWLQSSNVLPIMAQEVTPPDKPLAKSRTMANASVAGTVGVVLAAAPAIEPAGKVVELAQDNTQGFLLVIGIALVAFAAVAVYLRWDDKRKS